MHTLVAVRRFCGWEAHTAPLRGRGLYPAEPQAYAWG